MSFYDVAMEIIDNKLRSRDTLEKVIEKIQKASTKGQIAFYPCGVYSRIILNEIKKKDPALLSKVIGCFDKSSEATMGDGIKVYNIKKLDEFANNIALLVVTSNTFYSKEMGHIQSMTSYDGPVLKTSRFDVTFAAKDDDAIMAEIRTVYNLLADKKSKMTYLVTWLSRFLNDDDLTYIFEGEEEEESGESGQALKFKEYVIEGLDDVCQKELNAGLYEMKYVRPNEGDVVLDVGAYKGDTAIYFADRVGRRGKVYSFEPVRANYETLVDNLRRNKLDDIVVTVNKGCAPESGSLKVISSKSGAPWAFVSEHQGTFDVEMTSIDDFVEAHNINKLDFIKMDVEGFEESALRGALKTLKRFHPKLAICLYHQSSDILSIPQLIHQAAGDYRLYIRCRMEGPFGINLYCAKK